MVLSFMQIKNKRKDYCEGRTGMGKNTENPLHKYKLNWEFLLFFRPIKANSVYF